MVARDLGSGSSAYSGGSFSVARDESVAYALSTTSIPSEVAVVAAPPVATSASAAPPSAGRVRPALNADVLAGRTLGTDRKSVV